jgi:DNA-binding transcriptional LysR family regulator
MTLRREATMGIETLREFIHLSESLNFSKTAHHFFISQPTLSKRIKELESELDTGLLLRDSHSVKLTGAGKSFISDAKTVIAAHDTAIASVSQRKRLVNQSLSIGYLFGACRAFLPHAFRLFESKHLEVELSLYSLETDAAIEACKNNELDLGIGMLTAEPLPLFDSCSIFEDSVVCVVPENHPFGNRASISIYELDNSLVIPSHFPHQTQLHSLIRQKLHDLNINYIET